MATHDCNSVCCVFILLTSAPQSKVWHLSHDLGFLVLSRILHSLICCNTNILTVGMGNQIIQVLISHSSVLI